MKWDDSLLIGVKIVDEQHQELFNRINNLLDKMSRGEGREALEETYAFLSEFINEHFEDEESLMIEAGYGDYLSHRNLHRRFGTDFHKFKRKLDTSGPTWTLLVETETWLTDWWISHIQNVDKQLAAFLKSRAA